MAGMAGHLLEMAGNGRVWQDMAGHCWEWLGMTGMA